MQLEEYIINGDHHRIGGPAYVEYDINGNVIYEEYWIDGKKYDDVFQYYVVIAAM